jgi:hypothetical protein
MVLGALTINIYQTLQLRNTRVGLGYEKRKLAPDLHLADSRALAGKSVIMGRMNSQWGGDEYGLF